MKNFSKIVLFILFIIGMWGSALYMLYIIFDFPLLMDIGNSEYIPRAIIWFLYVYNCQKIMKRLTRKLNYNETYKPIL